MESEQYAKAKKALEDRIKKAKLLKQKREKQSLKKKK